MADEFSNLGKDISKAIKSVLNAKELQELKTTVQNNIGSAIDSAIDTTTESIKKINIQINRHSAAPKPPAAPKQYNYPVPVDKGSKPYSKIFSNLMIGAGTACAAIMGTGLLAAVILFLTSSLPVYATIPIGVLTGILMTAGIASASWGHRNKDMIQRLERYLRIIADKTYCEIQALASAVKKPAAFVVKDLQRMISDGMISEGYFDDQERTLILDYETYQQYLAAEQRARTIAEQQGNQGQPHTGQQSEDAQNLDQAGQSFIFKIRQINNALPDPDISAKLDSLENITKKIFDYVRQHPDKQPQIRKFMRYYLPTTLKLIEAYLELEDHGSITEVEKTKAEIRTALSSINKAFEKLFSSLLQNDLLNLSADISALESMLAMEGLSDEEFS